MRRPPPVTVPSVRHKAFYAAAAGLSPLLLVLAGCNGEDKGDNIGFWETAGDTGSGIGAEADVEPADFNSLELGPRTQDQVASLPGPSGGTGRIVSFVACPAGSPSCDPSAMPEGTVYTYVVEVTPAERTSAFRTRQPLSGFTGVAGFDAAQAAKAVAGDSRLALRCLNGALVWAAVGGEGWQAGAPITLFWQSTSPPGGPSEQYELVSEGQLSLAEGVYPTGDPEGRCS